MCVCLYVMCECVCVDVKHCVCRVGECWQCWQLSEECVSVCVIVFEAELGLELLGSSTRCDTEPDN